MRILLLLFLLFCSFYFVVVLLGRGLKKKGSLVGIVGDIDEQNASSKRTFLPKQNKQKEEKNVKRRPKFEKKTKKRKKKEKMSILFGFF